MSWDGRARSVALAPFAVIEGARAAWTARRERRLAVKVARASDPATSKPRLFAMTVLSGRRLPVGRALGGNPSTPKICLRLLARGPWDVAAAVAANGSTPRRVLARKRLAKHPTWAVRAAVAANTATPDRALQKLARSEDVVVRMHLARNGALAAHVVQVLLRDPDVYVRAVAATNPNAPSEGLARLARPMTEPAWVLRAAAANPKCPAPVSDEILTWIALGGTGNTDPTFDPITCTGHPGDTAVAAFTWYHNTTLASGDMHPLWRVRSTITSTWPRIPGAVLMRLAVDPQPEVRRSVSMFKELTRARLQHLAKDADGIVAQNAVRGLRRKNETQSFWKRRLTPRWLFAPLILCSFAITQANHNSSSYSSGRVPGAGSLAPGTLRSTSTPLPAGGFLLTTFTAGQSSVVVTVYGSPEPLELQFPVPAFTALESFGTQVQVEPNSTTTVMVSPLSTPLVIEVTTGYAVGNTTTTSFTIDYKGSLP